jgi:hypothetical protein
MLKLLLLTAVFYVRTNAVRKDPPKYNGGLKYYVADLTSAYPCSPHFDTTITWFAPNDVDAAYRRIRQVLDGLSDVGFNAIKLPLFPYSDEVSGRVVTSFISGTTEKWTRNDCHDISKAILAVMGNHTLSRPNDNDVDYYDDKYWYFKIYWAPAFDGRQY